GPGGSWYPTGRLCRRPLRPGLYGRDLERLVDRRRHRPVRGRGAEQPGADLANQGADRRRPAVPRRAPRSLDRPRPAEADDRRSGDPRPRPHADRLRRLGARTSAGDRHGRRPGHLDALHLARPAERVRLGGGRKGAKGMSTESHQFKIRGMDCAEEVAILKREIGPLVGGEAHLSFDLLKAKMTVLSAPGVNPREVVKAVERTGMGAQVWEDDAERLEPESFWLRRGRTVLTVASGAFALFGFAVHAALAGGISRALGSEGMGIAAGVPLASRVLYSLAILFGVWSVLPKAWNALRRFRPDMNLLMTIAVLGAVAIGEWFEGATVAFLFSLSLALESWSIGRARRAVEALMDLTPQTARIRKPDGHELEIPAEQVEIGALLLVKPGERIPLDGRVVGGASEVNQAPITGESVPVPKEIGAEVFAGTINGDGALEVEATKRAGDSTLA